MQMSSVSDTQKKLIEDAQKKFIDIQGKMTVLQNKVSAQSREVGSLGTSGGLSYDRKRSVLEYNIVKEYPVLSEEKKNFRE